MITVLPGKIEAANGVTNDVKPKGAGAEKADKKKDFVTELEHFLRPVSIDQNASPQRVSQDRFSQRAFYIKSQRSQKHPAGSLSYRIPNSKNTIHNLGFPNRSKELHELRSSVLDAYLRRKAKISYLKKQSAFSPQKSAKGKEPYSKLSKYLYETPELRYKNRKIGRNSKGNLGLENGEGRNSRVSKEKNWVMLYKRPNKPSNAGEKSFIQTSKESRGKDSVKDLSLLYSKYENNVPKVETGVRVHAHNYINRKGDEVFSEIVKQFTLIVNRGGGEARVVLEPPELGSMRLDIKLNHSEVNTNIVVENTAVKDLIESRLSMLQNSLLGQGFTLGSFSVEVKEKNTSPQMTADRNNAGAGASKIEEGMETVPQIQPVAGLPWLSTIVNITV
jgi:hypothetical protein